MQCPFVKRECERTLKEPLEFCFRFSYLRSNYGDASWRFTQLF